MLNISERQDLLHLRMHVNSIIASYYSVTASNQLLRMKDGKSSKIFTRLLIIHNV